MTCGNCVAVVVGSVVVSEALVFVGTMMLEGGIYVDDSDSVVLVLVLVGVGVVVGVVLVSEGVLVGVTTAAEVEFDGLGMPEGAGVEPGEEEPPGVDGTTAELDGVPMEI